MRNVLARVFFNKVAAGAAVAALIASAQPVSAASATADLNVSATVINNCVISTAALAFGNYDPVDVNAAANLDGTGTVTDVTISYPMDLTAQMLEYSERRRAAIQSPDARSPIA